MSILYLKLKSINSKGQFVDYKIFDVFKDIDEMLDWFAYGFDNATRKPIIADSENNFRYKDGSVDYNMNKRYEDFVSCHNLTGFDKVSSLLTPYEIRKLPCSQACLRRLSLKQEIESSNISVAANFN